MIYTIVNPIIEFSINLSKFATCNNDEYFNEVSNKCKKI